MELATCPCCGSVRPMGVLLKTRMHQQIFEYINSHPECSREDIYKAVWSGLHVSPNTLSVHIWRMKPVLKDYGLTIVAARGRSGGRFKVVKIEEANVPL